MTKLIYHEIPDYNAESVNQLLNSGEEYKIIEGLISIAFYSGDYQLSMDKAMEFVKHSNVHIKGCAIECFGHIARIHKKLDLDKVIPILKMGIIDEDEFIQDKTRFAIGDITQFLKVKLFGD